MKVLVFLFAIAFVSAQAVGSYTEQDPSIVETDANCKAALEFGETEFLQQAFAKGSISSPNLVAENVVSVATQVVSGLNYKFVVEFTDSQGKAIYATLVVYSQPWTKTLQLTSYEISDTPEF